MPMMCPDCGGDMMVTSTPCADEVVVRSRKCNKCGKKVNTVERIEEVKLVKTYKVRVQLQ